MNILEAIKSSLPVSRKTLENAEQRHKDEMSKLRDAKAAEIRQMRESYNKEYAKTVEAVREITDKMSSLQWMRLPYGDFAVQMNISAEMLRQSLDGYSRDMIAEQLGRRLAHEIKISKFIQ